MAPFPSSFQAVGFQRRLFPAREWRKGEIQTQRHAVFDMKFHLIRLGRIDRRSFGEGSGACARPDTARSARW